MAAASGNCAAYVTLPVLTSKSAGQARSTASTLHVNRSSSSVSHAFTENSLVFNSVTAVKRRNAPLRITATAATERKSVEKVEWKVKRETLLKNGVKSVPAKEALKLQGQGYILVDVRPKYEYEEVHPEGAVNAEVYRLIKEWTAWDILRRAGFAFFGVFTGTEENPDFIKEIEAAGISKNSKIIVACGFGGTMKPNQNFTDGKESRSLIAAYILSTEGFKNVLHLDGGLSTWFREDFPVTFKEE